MTDKARIANRLETLVAFSLNFFSFCKTICCHELFTLQCQQQVASLVANTEVHMSVENYSRPGSDITQSPFLGHAPTWPTPRWLAVNKKGFLVDEIFIFRAQMLSRLTIEKMPQKVIPYLKVIEF